MTVHDGGFLSRAVVRMAFAAALSLFSLSGSTAADEAAWLVANTVRGRALAMGGACSSLEDDLSAGIYNPGAFRINATRTERRFRLFLNPAGSAAAFNDYSTYDLDYQEDRELTETEQLRAALLLVKGAVFSTPAVDFGVVLNEPASLAAGADTPGERFVTAGRVTAGVFHTAFANVKIASSVSIGVGGMLFRTREDGKEQYRTGHMFGVLLDPTPKMKVGVTYSQLPEEVADTRMELERIGSGTVTGGISYYPDPKTVLSVDIRNMNRDDETASREIHAGFERVLWSRLALRGGYFRRKDTSRDVYSAGISLLPGWERISKYRYSTRNDLLSYSFITEAGDGAGQWHVLSLTLKL